MRTMTAVLSALVFSSGVATSASGQEAMDRVSWGVLGGKSFPTGPSIGMKHGHYVGALAEISWRNPGRALRFEVMSTMLQFAPTSASDSVGQHIGEVTGGFRLRAATANLVLRTERKSAVHSYLIAGVGAFGVHTRLEVPQASGSSSHTTPVRMRVGFNAGLGLALSLGRVTALTEARYHAVLHRYDQPELRMIPVSLGVRVR